MGFIAMKNGPTSNESQIQVIPGAGKREGLIIQGPFGRMNEATLKHFAVFLLEMLVHQSTNVIYIYIYILEQVNHPKL